MTVEERVIELEHRRTNIDFEDLQQRISDLSDDIARYDSLVNDLDHLEEEFDRLDIH